MASRPSSSGAWSSPTPPRQAFATGCSRPCAPSRRATPAPRRGLAAAGRLSPKDCDVARPPSSGRRARRRSRSALDPARARGGQLEEALAAAAGLGGAGRSPRSPGRGLLLGRHDLADVVHPLLEICRSPSAPRPCRSAMLVSASSATEAADLRAWAGQVQEVDEHDPTGLGGLMQWVAWPGRVTSSAPSGLHRGFQRPPSVAGGAGPVRGHRGAGPLQPHHRRGRSRPASWTEPSASPIAADVASPCGPCRLGAVWALIALDPSSLGAPRPLGPRRCWWDPRPHPPGAAR